MNLPYSGTIVTGEEERLLITGGGNDTSITIYPTSNGCSLPSLPSPRPHHKAFLTAGSEQEIAVCGGGWSTSCLVFDHKTRLWDDGKMGDTNHRWSEGSHAVSLPDIGVFIFGGGRSETDFLPAGSMEWQEGPEYPSSIDGSCSCTNCYNCQCAVPISPTSFLVITPEGIHEFDSTIAGPTSSRGWISPKPWYWSPGKWPTLKDPKREERFSCSKFGQKVIISGGLYDDCNDDWYQHWSCEKKLRSTEILDLVTRRVSSGGDMHRSRHGFHLATVRTFGQLKMFAIGGDGCYKCNTGNVGIEEWIDEHSRWQWVGDITIGGSNVVTVPKNLICPA